MLFFGSEAFYEYCISEPSFGKELEIQSREGTYLKHAHTHMHIHIHTFTHKHRGTDARTHSNKAPKHHTSLAIILRVKEAERCFRDVKVNRRACRLRALSTV